MKTILLKISWESLSGEMWSIDTHKADLLAKNIYDLHQSGVKIVLVFWWGNIYRGSKLVDAGLPSGDSHNMSMLSTVFNGTTMKHFLEKRGITTYIMDALHIDFLEPYNASKAREYLQKGNIVICTSWTGSPFFTTDTTGVLRSLELHCDAMIKITKVDGVYESDPLKNPQAKRYAQISYDDVIRQNLTILDQTAVIMARDNTLPIYVTSLEGHNYSLGIEHILSSASKIG